MLGNPKPAERAARPVCAAAALLALYASFTAAAQETALRLTLVEAVERARAESPRLLALQALERAAGEGVRSARGARLPQLELSGWYARSSDVPELTLALPGAPPRTIFPNIPDAFRTRAAAAVPVYTGGRVSQAIESARRQQEASARDAEAAAHDVVFETRSAYWALVAAREAERVLAEAKAAFEGHLRDARNRRDLGLAASNEVLAVQVERDRAELQRLEAANDAALANANLVRLLGLGAGAEVEPIEPRTPPALPPLDTPALAAKAEAGRSELQALRSRAAAAAASAHAARAAALPQASVTAAYEYANPNLRVLPLTAEWRSTWSVGLQLSWTVFDGGRAGAAAAQLEAQADALRRQLDDARRRLAFEVTHRVLDLSTARAALEVAERNREAAGENLRVARDRYREGVLASSELLDAETVLLRAGLDHTQAVARLHVGLAALDRAVGR
jgi:outer membrane protein TolC